MHQPWNHADDITHMFKDDRVTANSVTEALRKSLDEARTLAPDVSIVSVEVTIHPESYRQLALDLAFAETVSRVGLCRVLKYSIDILSQI